MKKTRHMFQRSTSSSTLQKDDQTLTDSIVHLVAVLFQVVLNAALEEIQLGFELLGEAEHAVLTPGQVGVVAQEAQPAGEQRQGMKRGEHQRSDGHD